MPVFPPAPVIVESPSLLAIKAYRHPTVDTLQTTTSTTFVDVDATNLVVTFIAPPSGKVLVVLNAPTKVTTASLRFNLRDASGNIADTDVLVTGAIDLTIGSSKISVAGLVPGNTYTWKWGWRVSAAATGTIYHGPLYGQVYMEVWDANPTYSQQLIQPGIGAPERIEAELAADAPIVANTIVSLLTISLPPGTWQVGATALGQNVGGWFHIKMHVGATVYGSMEAYNPANGGGCALSVPVRRIVVPPGSNQTVSLSGGTDSSSGNFKHKAILTVFNTGTEGTVTRLWAIREAA